MIEITIGIGLFLIFYFVALPGFEDLFDHVPNPLGPVIGCSVAYFIVAGLFEAFVVSPILVHYLVRATRSGRTDNSSAMNFARALYWIVVVGVYYNVMRNYLVKKKQAKAQN